MKKMRSQDLVTVGTFYLEGNPELALAFFDRARNAGQASAHLYRQMGYAHAFMGRPGQALEFFFLALEAQPDDVSLRFDIALVYFRLGEYDHARWMLEPYEYQYSRSPLLHYLLGTFYLELGIQHSDLPDQSTIYLEEAESHLETAVEIEPYLFMAAVGLGRLYEYWGDYKAACRWYRRANHKLAMSEVRKTALTALTRIYDETGKTNLRQKTLAQLESLG